MLNRLFGSRYRIKEKIGIGGMAEVYKATDEGLGGRTVAVKVMLPQYAADPTFAVRFKQEAEAAANLQSPYIVNIYDWGHDEADSTYYIVMEYVRGTDLKTAINQRGAINQRKVAEIGSQVCAALGVAHSYDIIHRDIKPHNIMVQPDGNTKVLDFGIARAGNSQMTQTGSVLGTAYYVSPEQAQGKPLNASTDIYSLGVVLYEAATGTVPFDGDDPVSIAVKQVNERPRPPREINPDIDAAFEAIILKAMQKNPADRFATAEQMRSALNDYLAGRPSGFVDPNAQTSLIGGGAAGGAAAGVARSTAATAAAATAAVREKTEVMPSLSSTLPADPTSRSGRLGEPGYEHKGRKRAAIVIAVIAVLAIIAIGVVLAFQFLQPTGEQVTVPSVVKLTKDDATRELTTAGLAIGNVTEENSETIEAGKVISQNPAASTKTAKGTKIDLVISKGSGKVEVPELRDMTPAEAEKALADLQLAYGFGQNKPDPDIEVGRICGQNPAAGQMVAIGTKIIYDLSSGPDSITIPNVYGMPKTDAEAALRNAGFEVAYAESVYSSSVADGSVVSQDKTGSGKKGDTVTLTLSKGAEPEPTPQVNVPNVVGMNLASANSAMVNVGLVLNYSGSPDASQTVVSQNPAAGTKVDKGSSVSVTFSAPSPAPSPTPTPE
ncbi:MAG: Stk1 family PASTA domain-containing Ser/Thr kinase [Coriobacteriales bacterium]|nr:Stk1 family PASTA domain-containing Ser/Thr kinase [Coriobacteriales bacterium]